MASDFVQTFFDLDFDFDFGESAFESLHSGEQDFFDAPKLDLVKDGERLCLGDDEDHGDT